MEKFLYVIPLTLILTGCGDSLDSVRIVNNTTVVATPISELCLNGVGYYFYASGNKAGLSVIINPVTLQPVNCK